MRPALALVLVHTVAGCALMTDGIHHLAGPEGGSSSSGTALGTGRTTAWREIAVEPAHGLICREVEQPWVRTAQVATRVTNPNGYKAATQFFTVAEYLALGLVIAVHEHTCATSGCDARTGYYPWFAPLAADIAWGTYRSFTIHDEILRATELGWTGPTGGETTTVWSEPCAPGTEVPLYAGADQLVVHVGTAGFTLEAELPSLAGFLADHATFAVGGANIRLDAARGPELAATITRARASAAAAAVAPAVGSVPLAPRAPRAVIRWGVRLPSISGVTVDFELSAVCRGDADCATGQRCADRGDGVPLCMGPRASHAYCARDADCGQGRCEVRADGVGQCR